MSSVVGTSGVGTAGVGTAGVGKTGAGLVGVSVREYGNGVGAEMVGSDGAGVGSAELALVKTLLGKTSKTKFVIKIDYIYVKYYVNKILFALESCRK